jgi:uncharacterized protein with LGFP repeats
MTIILFAGCTVNGFIQSHNDRQTKERIISKEGSIIGYGRKKKYVYFQEAYTKNGGQEKLGIPNGFVENYNCFNSEEHCTSKIQKYSGGSEEQGVIIQSSHASQAYWIGGAFWPAFKKMNTRSSIAPISDRENYGKWSMQRFSDEGELAGCGAIFQIPIGILYTSGDIGCHYFYEEKGEKGRLGMPVSDPIEKNNSHAIQYFENGCIEREIVLNSNNIKSIVPRRDCPKF